MDNEIEIRLERIFRKLNDQARKKILVEGMSSSVKSLLLLKEILKEQMPNENTRHTTR